ncbi:MAG: DUF3488 and transglutaminase-like domain-containing protein, partial [Burkholderiaceae bacterium]|nr:DUF3488 and transglutaminase-like domain-containing protein [Burkholderiaceae bacterium]
PAPPQAQLYWRGPVLTHFDGRAWRALPAGQMQAPAQGLGAALAYTLTVEPHERLWLFALGLPAELPPETRLAEGMQLTSTRPLTQRRRLELRSHPRYRLGAAHAELAAALQLPPGYNPRTRALAQRWRTEVSGAEQLVARALALFRRDFTYTLLPPPLGAHSVDEFLFDTRRGFCEHYAGAFVFLM